MVTAAKGHKGSALFVIALCVVEGTDDYVSITVTIYVPDTEYTSTQSCVYLVRFDLSSSCGGVPIGDPISAA